jgi:F-type H+-transporting ATPase subunit c
MDFQFAFAGAALGAAIAAVAAAMGIGKISAAACESIARQPEAAGDIKGNTVLTAAFIEGVCLFACVIALLVNGNVFGAAKTQTALEAVKSGKSIEEARELVK